jgi:hypothetical protein
MDSLYPWATLVNSRLREGLVQRASPVFARSIRCWSPAVCILVPFAGAACLASATDGELSLLFFLLPIELSLYIFVPLHPWFANGHFLLTLRMYRRKWTSATQQKDRELGFDQLETHYQQVLVLEEMLRCVD